MSFFKRLFGKTPPVPKLEPSENQAVMVYLKATGLPERVYRERDLSTIEDRLTEVIQRDGLGEFDGNEVGGGEATLFMYGPSAERLYAGIEPTLRADPLCKGARVVIRLGGPGTTQRIVQL
jgi:hypothetical protein